jgi:hypothetical protein
LPPFLFHLFENSGPTPDNFSAAKKTVDDKKTAGISVVIGFPDLPICAPAGLCR